MPALRDASRSHIEWRLANYRRLLDTMNFDEDVKAKLRRTIAYCERLLADRGGVNDGTGR